MTRALRLFSPALAVAGVALFVVLSGGASAAAVLASGHETAASQSKPLVTDPRDAGGKLDLRAAKRLSPDARCLVSISTWGSWSSTILEGSNYTPGKNQLLVLYDLNGDNRPDLTGNIIFVSNAYFYLFIDSNPDFAPAGGSRTSPSSVAVKVCQPLFQLMHIPRTVRVAFESVNRTHRDRMPDRGWIRLRVL